MAKSDSFSSLHRKSIARIQEFEPREGYWLGFSGGKDSVCILHLARLAQVKFDAHYSMTTCDPPELVRFIRDRFPSVSIEKPPQSIWQMIPKWGFPTRKNRWCCHELKERGGAGRLVMTGIRSEESNARKSRKMIETCIRDPRKRFLHPIIDWTEGDVWGFISANGLPHSALYDEGFRRLGCVICPFATDTVRNRQRWPKVFNAARLSFRKLYDKRWPCIIARWDNGDEMFEWWCDRKAPYPKPKQRI